MKALNSRRNVLMRLLLGSFTILVSVAAYYSYRTVRNLTLESLKKNAFLEVQQGATAIDYWLTNLKIHIETLASTPVVRSMKWSVVEPYLKTEAIRFSDVSTIGLAKLDGWEQALGEPVNNVQQQTYFQKAIAGQTNVSDPLPSRTSQTYRIIVAAPIRQQFDATSSAIGEIHSSVNLDRIAQVVEQVAYGENSYAFALNSKGEAIVHPNPALVANSQTPAKLMPEDKGFAAIAQRMVQKQQGIELAQIDGIWQYVAYLPLQEADWSVALVIPRENIEGPLRSLDIVALVAGGLAATMIATLWQIHSVEQTQLQKSNEDLEQRVTERTVELSTALEKLKQSQFQLVQSEKMSSLGQLVAGVAHEINNPVNFIHGNLVYVDRYSQTLFSLISLYQQEYPVASPTLQAALEDSELSFMATDLPKILSSMKIGTDRIREIVLSLRTFSRMDEAEKKLVDIHAGLESTLMILQHRFKPQPNQRTIQIVKHYGELPWVECYAGQLNQVFINILANAIDAIELQDDGCEPQEQQNDPGVITITTNLTATGQIRISIADNGPGMTEETQQRLFDPFYTTKPVGKGTGLGLSISYQIVTERHNGSLECFSTPGKGAEFVIQIPIRAVG